MKKTLAILLAMMMAFSAVALAVAADFSVTQQGSEYSVTSPTTVEFVSIPKDGGKDVKMAPQAGCTIEALFDGELVRDASGFATKGIVLFQNQGFGVDSDLALVPEFAFVMDYGKEVTFDTAYFTIYHEIKSCIAIPGDKQVIVEISDDGNVWVPVGDGIFYFNADVDEFVDGVDDKEIVECAVYLGEEVSAQYVRYTYTFMPVPEGGYWQYHTNIYEWCGFTELGVATWTGGEEPEVLDAETAGKEPTEVEGSWIGDDGVETKIMNFVNNAGDKKVDVTVYDSEAYLESGIDAAVADQYTATYSVVGDKLVISYEDGSIDRMSAVIDEEGDLTLGVGSDAVTYSPYEAPAPVEMSGVWFAEVEGIVMVVDFSTAGTMKMLYFDPAVFEESGVDGEATLTMELPYTAAHNHIAVDMEGEIEKLYVSYEGENLILDDGETPMNLAPYVPKEPAVSEPEDESSVPEDESSEEGDTSAPATSAPAESSADTSVAPAEDGDNTLVIVIVAVAAVVIIAAVVVILIKRKK